MQLLKINNIGILYFNQYQNQSSQFDDPKINNQIIISQHPLSKQFQNTSILSSKQMNTTSPAFSIPLTSRKVFTNDYDDSPGPKYNTFGLGIKHKSLSYGVSLSQRTPINYGIQKTPAPGQYNPQKFINNKKKITIPKDQHQQKLQNDMPDPGFYQPNYDVSKKKLQAFSMGTKYPSIMDDVKKTPGPGAYQTMRKTISSDKKLRKSQSTFNITSTRFNPLKKSPGPGDYNLLTQDKILSPDNKGKFGNGPKFPINKFSNPGPGQYENLKIQLAMKSKLGTTISGKFKQGSFIPTSTTTDKAFGIYEIVQSTKKIRAASPQYKIGKSKRRIFQGNDIPGPLDYIKENYKAKHTFRATMPYSYREEFQSTDNPGPGAYELKHKKSLTYTIPRSQSSKYIVSNPGVGRYDVDKNAISRNTKSNKFYTSGRANFISKNVAGVGDYEIYKKKSQNITIPKSQRFSVNDRKPGPGDYYIPSSIGKYNNFGKSKRI